MSEAVKAMAKGESKFPDPELDYRKHPEAYRIDRGEVGVLTVEPYKSELLPHWRFRTPEIAKVSAQALYKAFLAYGKGGDFVGMDMARKFIQMGYTRSRRYARHRSGRKYDEGGEELPEQPDETKQRSAEIFQAMLNRVRANELYQKLKREHQQRVKAGRK